MIRKKTIRHPALTSSQGNRNRVPVIHHPMVIAPVLQQAMILGPKLQPIHRLLFQRVVPVGNWVVIPRPFRKCSIVILAGLAMSVKFSNRN